MRKAFVILSVLLATLQAGAQQFMWVKSGGVVDAVDTSTVDYVTFDYAGDLFDIYTTNTYVEDETTLSSVTYISQPSQIKGFDATMEVGVCYSSENDEPTVDDSCQLLGTKVGDYSFQLLHLTAKATYHFRVYVKLYNKVYYGETVSVTMKKS